MDPIEKMRMQVQKGLESPEAAMAACEAISEILDQLVDDESDAGMEGEPDINPDPNGQEFFK